MKTQVVQKAIVLNKTGHILILRRSMTDTRRPLQWDLPGGMVEKGEELKASVEREISEEAGLKVTEINPIYAKSEIRTWKNRDNEKTVNVVFIFYLAKTDNNKVVISFEHDKYQWCSIEEAFKQFKYHLHKELLEYVLNNKLT
jgi:8-oxo-dGTP diphosphatase